MMWLLRSWQNYADDRELETWGTKGEKERYHRFTCPKRREEWLLGRLTAKELIQRYWKRQHGITLSFSEIHIDNEAGGKPYFQIQNKPKSYFNDPDLGIQNQPTLSLCHFGLQNQPAMSLSHCRFVACCALSDEDTPQGFGLDLEYVEPRPSLFVDTFFREEEKRSIEKYSEKQYWQAVTAIWSLKEAALKALACGLRRDTRDLCVSLSPLSSPGWQPAPIQVSSGETMEAKMRFLGDYVLSVAKLVK